MDVESPAAAEAGSNAPTAPQWVVFSCSGERLALPLTNIQQILTPRPFTRLPGAGAGVAGLIGVRGRMITCYDLGAALGIGPARASGDYRILLVDAGARVAGLVVDEVHAAAALELPEPDASPVDALVLGTCKWEGAPVGVLEAARVLAHVSGERT